MVGFTRYDNALYLPTADIGDVAQARIGFLFQDATRTDPTFDLTQASWTDPAQQGYFFFFLPSAQRDWSLFAGKVRTLFGQTAQAQFAWISEQGTGSSLTLTAATLIQVTNQGTASPSPSGPFSFAFATNIALTVPSSPFLPSVISFDDAGGQFLFPNQASSSNPIVLTARPPSGAQQSFPATSSALTLSMNGGGDPNGGSVNATFAFAVADLAAFEAGMMYFDPGANNLLGAFSFPVVRAPGGAAAPLQFSAWLDVLSPLDGVRSYFRYIDSLVGSYFATANGKAIALTTTAGADLSQASRLVFANRPVHTASDTSTYYLTIAGTFGLGLDGGESTLGPAALLCGTAGTEFLTVNVATGAADSLVFVPGNPAFQKTTPPTTPGASPQFLDSMDGNVTTSWAQLKTAAGGYVSQPQDSPLYQQSGSVSASAADANAALDVYLLDFLALPSWSAAHAAPQAASGATSSPLVPIVPFAGLFFSTPDESAPYLQIESTALNPTRKNSFTQAAATVSASRRAKGLSLAASADADLTYAMTPPGLLAGLSGTGADQLWETTRIAISPPLVTGDPSIYLQFTAMEDQIRAALQQNQIFLVISTLTNPNPPGNTLFGFAGTDQQINIAGWPFSLSPTGTPSADDIPPIVMMKFYPGQSIKDLVADTSLWSQADTFNGSGFTAEQAQAYLTQLIEDAEAAVAKDGPSSLYYNFYQVVTDPAWSGLLAVNANMQLNNLPTAIKAVTGGMTYPGNDGKPVSNIDAFRVHHVGVSINDTDPAGSTPTLSQSSLFGLVDYEKPASPPAARLAASQLDTFYNFEVEYLRALFTNSALESFSCKINLTINNLFGTDVTGDSAPPASGSAAADDANIIVISGSYQAHSTSGDDSSSGEGVYSFVSEAPFKYTFGTNPYLDTITLNKVQFSFLQETDTAGSDTSNIQASFGIWGSLVFKQFEVLDIFAFKDLVFNDLGISVSFDLTVPATGSPYTANTQLAFNPGNLRLDLAASEPREGDTSLLRLLPFKLTSFLYNQYPDEQTVESLGYFSLSDAPLDPGFTLTNKFNYGLIFELDLGGLGALVGSLEAFKFGFLIGWAVDNGAEAGGIAFGVQIPQANGKLQIKIQGVLDLLIEQFILRYEKPADGGAPFLVVALHNSSLTVLGVRLPPGEAQIDVALFAPIGDSAHIGWIAAYNNSAPPPPSPPLRVESSYAPGVTIENGGGVASSLALADEGGGTDGDGGGAFELIYLGLGQRVGPGPDDTPTTFAEFMTFMTTDFWDAIENNEYDKVYHPDGQWLALTNFKLLKIIEVGFVFYDTTPFYSLTLNVQNLFNFEITYTKISDSIGLFYAEFSLPDSLRTYQVGAASLTLPSIGVSVYTNGNWKLDVGFPNGDDWSKSFRVEAQAGPVPVTGAGGFYIASLSSATTDVFVADYASILAFGFAARLGVGKNFVAGPLKAGVSVTFFGIIQGAAGYHIASSDELFKKPDALALTGQFGVIGELYGSIDFVIIKASVNVRLQASIGIVLKYEPLAGNDGSILLYIEASVSVSVSVKINLFLFSITISFSFNASFRFDWQLAGPSQNAARLESRSRFRHARMLALAADDTVTILPLIPGFTTALPIWFTPEGTAIFADSISAGVPWVVSSLALQYDPAPPSTTSYSSFMPFEKLTTQLVTWAVGRALGEAGWNYSVEQTALSDLDQDPAHLLAGIDYEALLDAMAVFSTATLVVPHEPDGSEVSAATFPMFPFLHIATTGRMAGGSAADFNYVFADKNIVSSTYIEALDAYFNQLFVNQSNGAAPIPAPDDDATTTPLVQEIFTEYMNGLIRGGVNQLLQTMQNGQLANATIDTLILDAVKAGQFASLSGQMSSSFRGGVRLPYTAGLTVPGGDALTTTNPLYALLWQEFPVGDLGSSGQYSIALSNPDTSQAWLTVPATASWDLTSAWLKPLQGILPSAIVAPSTPAQLPFTDIGPQSFAFDNAIVWTQPTGTTTSLRPFPSSLQTLQAAQGAPISMLVESREGGAPYLPGGTPLEPGSFDWATQITLRVSQVPDALGQPLKDVFALNGASEQDEQLLEQILEALPGGDLIASIQILYQTAAGSSGLTSQTVTAADVFVLRTNSTTVSAPPTFSALALAAVPTPTTPVGAQIDEYQPFLEIVQQAVVTNAPGYYLRYLDSSNNSLPTTLFTSGPAPLTILITYLPDTTLNTPASPASVRPFYNAITIDNADPALIYYTETTDPALTTQYSTVAAGCIGVVMTRDDSSMKVAPSTKLLETAGVEHGRRYDTSELISALVAGGVKDEAELHAILADASSGPAQLNALYSLVTYQVAATTGFIASNLSAPIQPQQPDSASSAADGLTGLSDDTRSYRVYVPLYGLATANQPMPEIPNRYASIADPVSMAFFQNDAFGNQMPGSLPFAGTNYYFDPIVPVDQWQGIVSVYDFDTASGPQRNNLTVYLTPSKAAFDGFTPDQIASSLQSWTTIQDQITGPGISFTIETNLALQAGGGMIEVQLSGAQAAAVVAMVGKMVAWLENPTSVFPADPVVLTVAATGVGTIPPIFEMVVLLVVERDPTLISPLLKDQFGNVTFPSAQRANTTIGSTVGSSLPDGTSVPITAFAADFVKAFPAFALSVGLGGASETASTSKAQRNARQLRTMGVQADSNGSGQAVPQSLWAVQQLLLDVSIGVGAQSGPYYASPTPLDNTLNSALVPLPTLPAGLPGTLPASQLFTDVDLDVFNSSFFEAVDLMLTPALAAAAFEQARDAYTTIANGRSQLADLYSSNEIDWLFDANAPFTGPAAQLTMAQDAFGQQMRAALATAYTTDTIVQYGVSWAKPLPAGIDGMYELFGAVRPASGDVLPKGFTISAPHVPINSNGSSVLTFLFGLNDVRDVASVSLDLAFNITHIQHFLEPASATPDDEARPSIWLQLVDTAAAPHIGPAGEETVIPLVLRAYPTPPTLIRQMAIQGGGTLQAPNSNPLVEAAAWHLQYAYQVQLTAHDQILTAVTYNSDLSVANGGGAPAPTRLAGASVQYTLFQSLARFWAAYAVLQPILTTPTSANWVAAIESFAELVESVVNNSTWTPNPSALAMGGPLVRITDHYSVSDVAQSGASRVATLGWADAESSFAGVTVSIEALDPSSLAPYPDQTQQRLPQSVAVTYTPQPPLADNWIVHQIEIDDLNVLAAENALAAVQIERNLIEMSDPGGNEWFAKAEFVYMTPVVSATEPITPFVDNATPINVATLPDGGICSACTATSGTGTASLCQYVYRIMNGLLANDVSGAALAGARLVAGLDNSTPRRMKMACSFQYPVASVGGVTSANPVMPLVPIVLARSFLIDGSDPAQLGEFSALFAEAITTWTTANAVAFGAAAQAGAQLVFDLTLFAELSGVNTPVLRLRALQLKTADVTP
ncbi:hypothetical protein BH11PSE6_BH11PSE6_04310 [soil metagenome]